MRCNPSLTNNESPSSWLKPVVFLIFAATVLSLAGCGGPAQQLPIQPGSSGQKAKSFGLGPAVRPLSFGPGDKSSPVWSPSGDNVAFVIDGYVAEKSLGSRELRRRTTKNFGAEQVAWLPSSDTLAVLGNGLSGNSAPRPPSSAEKAGSVYFTRSGTEPLSIKKASGGDVLAMNQGPGGEGLVVALKEGSSHSTVALIDQQGRLKTSYEARVDGEITGLALSPGGKNAVLAAQSRRRCRLYTFSFADGTFRRIAELKPDMEVLGAPQWTSRGIYYVAGKPAKTSSGKTPLYHLYRTPNSGSSGSNLALAPNVGEDFTTSSIQTSPDGGRLAVIGRRSSGSSANLYLLNLSNGSLEALTTNENMEIRAGPGDLAWSSDGKRIAIVARGTLQGPEIYSAPASALLKAFYNLYEVSADAQGGGTK